MQAWLAGNSNATSPCLSATQMHVSLASSSRRTRRPSWHTAPLLARIRDLSRATVYPSRRLWVLNNASGSERQPSASLDMPSTVALDSRHLTKGANALRIGIVGFGKFGQFLAKRWAARGHKVIATSRTDYCEEAQRYGVTFFQDIDDFCEEHPEVVILATSILSTEKVLSSMPVQRLRRSTLVVDVLSVKVFPKQLLLRYLPAEMDILCTHPMFGPNSGKYSWEGLNFMYEKVRIAEDPHRQQRCASFLQLFQDEGCQMVEMSCEEHDDLAASTQFITHTVGRTLGVMGIQSTSINTQGFEALLTLVSNTQSASFELYCGLFLFNPTAMQQLEQLEKALDQVKKKLLEASHEIGHTTLLSDVSIMRKPPSVPTADFE